MPPPPSVTTTSARVKRSNKRDGLTSGWFILTWDLTPDFGSVVTGGIARQRGHITGRPLYYWNKVNALMLSLSLLFLQTLLCVALWCQEKRCSERGGMLTAWWNKEQWAQPGCCLHGPRNSLSVTCWEGHLSARPPGVMPGNRNDTDRRCETDNVWGKRERGLRCTVTLSQPWLIFESKWEGRREWGRWHLSFSALSPFSPPPLSVP